jgi:hypothetical protein
MEKNDRYEAYFSALEASQKNRGEVVLGQGAGRAGMLLVAP